MSDPRNVSDEKEEYKKLVKEYEAKWETYNVASDKTGFGINRNSRESNDPMVLNNPRDTRAKDFFDSKDAFTDAKTKLDTFLESHSQFINDEYTRLAQRYERKEHNEVSDDSIAKSDFKQAKTELEAFLTNHPEFVELENKRKIELEKQAIRVGYSELESKYRNADYQAKNTSSDDTSGFYNYLEKLKSAAAEAKTEKEKYYEKHLQVVDPGEYERRQAEYVENERMAKEEQDRKVAEQKALEQREAEERQREAEAKQKQEAVKEEEKKQEARITREYDNHCTKGLKAEKYEQAIEEFDQAIALSKDPLIKKNFSDVQRASVYFNRGNVHQTQGKNLQEAIKDYDKAIDISDDVRIKNLISKMLAQKTKKEIFKAIKSIPDTDITIKKELLDKCKDPDSLLGERMWKQRGVKECSLERGTLAKIQKYIDNGYKDVEKVQQKGNSPSLVKPNFSKFFKNKQTETGGEGTKENKNRNKRNSI